MGSLETASSHDMRITKQTFSPCVFIGMLSGLMSYVFFMKVLAEFRAVQGATTKPEYDIIQITSIILCATITFYFAVGGIWGYIAGTAYRRYQLANQTCNRADYGTMASEA
jgi:hypothetical protein